jgi:hypothetical protein
MVHCRVSSLYLSLDYTSKGEYLSIISINCDVLGGYAKRRRDITNKFGSFCDDYFDALATLCHGICDESGLFETLFCVMWKLQRT